MEKKHMNSGAFIKGVDHVINTGMMEKNLQKLSKLFLEKMDTLSLEPADDQAIKASLLFTYLVTRIQAFLSSRKTTKEGIKTIDHDMIEIFTIEMNCITKALINSFEISSKALDDHDEYIKARDKFQKYIQHQVDNIDQPQTTGLVQ